MKNSGKNHKNLKKVNCKSGKLGVTRTSGQNQVKGYAEMPITTKKYIPLFFLFTKFFPLLSWFFQNWFPWSFPGCIAVFSRKIFQRVARKSRKCRIWVKESRNPFWIKILCLLSSNINQNDPSPGIYGSKDLGKGSLELPSEIFPSSCHVFLKFISRSIQLTSSPDSVKFPVSSQPSSFADSYKI